MRGPWWIVIVQLLAADPAVSPLPTLDLAAPSGAPVESTGQGPAKGSGQVPGEAPAVPAAPNPGEPLRPAPVGASPPALTAVDPPKDQGPWLGVPPGTWIAFGVGAALLGTGLVFGLSAADIDHRAGSNLSNSGVDLGLTRATAVAGRNDALIANGLFVGAAVAAAVGLALVIFAPPPPAGGK